MRVGFMGVTSPCPLIPSSLAGRGGFGVRQNRGGVICVLDSRVLPHPALSGIPLLIKEREGLGTCYLVIPIQVPRTSYTLCLSYPGLHKFFAQQYFDVLHKV
jgi:hypothetical protein